MQNSNNELKEILGWILTGLTRLKSEPARWLGMTLVYLAMALVLKRIPFFGNYVLAFLTPIAIASAMIALRSPIQPSPSGAKNWLHALTREGARELFQVFRHEEYALLIIITCIVTLGLFVVISIPELLITGGSVISGIAGVSLGGQIRPMMIFNIIVAIALYTVLAMGLFYLVPLTLFGNRHAIPAVAESFRTCVRERKRLALFVAPFLVVNLGIVFTFNIRPEWGYLLLAVVGVIALPVFIIGLHRSYQTLFEATPVAAASPMKSAART